MDNEISTLVENQRQKFMAVASKDVNFDREAQFVMQLLNSNDYLAGVARQNKSSVIAAVNNVAAIGISLNPAQKLAYLVPRRVNKIMSVCLDISYMGLLHIAQVSGAIKWGQAEIVHTNDTFNLQNIDQPPHHGFNPFSTDRGEIVGCYVVVKTVDNDYLTHSMRIDEIFAIRDRSESWKMRKAKEKKGEDLTQSPWATDEKEMIKKTVIKQASKYWPRRERLDTAVHYLNDVSNEGISFSETPHDLARPSHSVVGETLSQLSVEEQDQAKEVAVKIMELLDEGFEWTAHDFYTENTQDSDMKEGIWAALGQNKTKVNGKDILYRSILTKLHKADVAGERLSGGDE
jgi:recombination protein RecT